MSKKTKKQPVDEVDPILGRRLTQPAADPRAEVQSTGEIFVGSLGDNEAPEAPIEWWFPFPSASPDSNRSK
jgi:hypothetical protein